MSYTITDSKTRRRIIVASTIGTTIEFYDFYVYATAAVAVFPHLFFPKNEDPTVGLLASFATFGLAFLGRPLGSLIFGHFGDRIGRKATLVGSLLTMGIATFLIAFIPPYEKIGLLAPAILALMRFSQGLGLGGEWSGAALLATETAQKGRRAWAAMWPQLGAPFGFFLANGFFLVLVALFGYQTGDLTGAFMTWGWRIPFAVSIVMVLVGLYVRVKLDETPVFQQAVDQGKRTTLPLKEVFATSMRPMLIGTFVMLSCYTLFYLVTTWVLSYGIAEKGLGIPYIDFLKLQLISIFAFMIGIPLSGQLADKRGRRRTLTAISFIMIGFGTTFHYFLDASHSSETRVLIFLSLGMFIMGLIFGPMSAVLPELFPTNVRYTGSGISYNLASIFGAAVAPFIATALTKEFGVHSVGLYLIGVSIITLIAVRLMRETKDVELSEI